MGLILDRFGRDLQNDPPGFIRPMTCLSGLAPIITTSSLPDGNVAAAYSQALAASGGTLPLVWSVLSGSVPAGLALSAAGVLSGTPTTVAGYNFTVKVQDNVGRVNTRAYTMSITAALWVDQPEVANSHWSTVTGQGASSQTSGTTFRVVVGTGARCIGVAFRWAGVLVYTYRCSLWNITTGARLAYVDFSTVGGAGVKHATFATPYVFPAGTSDIFCASIWYAGWYIMTADPSPTAQTYGTAYAYLASRNWANGDACPTTTAAGERYIIDPMLQVPG